MNLYIISVITALFLVSIITRFLPFVVHKQLSKSNKLQVLGAKLPAYIMTLLLIYQLHPQELGAYKQLLITLVSLLVVILAHKIIRKPIISICIGTLCYSLLNI